MPVGAESSDGNVKNQIVPTAIVPITEIGIQKYPEPSALTVDASEVNPKTQKSKKKSRESN